MTKPVLITWGYDSNSGKLYLDCYMDIERNPSCVHAAKMIELRTRTQGTHLALLHVPVECTREILANYIEKTRGKKKIQELLNAARVSYAEITRPKSNITSVNFLLDYDYDD